MASEEIAALKELTSELTAGDILHIKDEIGIPEGLCSNITQESNLYNRNETMERERSLQVLSGAKGYPVLTWWHQHVALSGYVWHPHRNLNTSKRSCQRKL